MKKRSLWLIKDPCVHDFVIFLGELSCVHEKFIMFRKGIFFWCPFCPSLPSLELLSKMVSFKDIIQNPRVLVSLRMLIIGRSTLGCYCILTILGSEKTKVLVRSLSCRRRGGLPVHRSFTHITKFLSCPWGQDTWPWGPERLWVVRIPSHITILLIFNKNTWERESLDSSSKKTLFCSSQSVFKKERKVDKRRDVCEW